MLRAWMPWIILTRLRLPLGPAADQGFARRHLAPQAPGRTGSTTWCRSAAGRGRSRQPEAAVYNLNLLSATGTGILLAAIVGGFVLGYRAGRPDADVLAGRSTSVRYSLLTIAACWRSAIVTRYSGLDATHGPRLRADRRALSLLRHAAGLAGRGADRLRHLVQRAVRRAAEDHGGAARAGSRC